MRPVSAPREVVSGGKSGRIWHQRLLLDERPGGCSFRSAGFQTLGSRPWSDFTQTRSHWWWRPGWGPGARFLTFHLTFERAPELQATAA